MLQAAPPPSKPEQPPGHPLLALAAILLIAFGAIASIYLLDWRWVALGLVTGLAAVSAGAMLPDKRR